MQMSKNVKNDVNMEYKLFAQLVTSDSLLQEIPGEQISKISLVEDLYHFRWFFYRKRKSKAEADW